MQTPKDLGTVYKWRADSSGEVHSDDGVSPWEERTFYHANITDENHGHVFFISFGRYHHGDKTTDFVKARNGSIVFDDKSFNFTLHAFMAVRESEHEVRWFLKVNASLVEESSTDVTLKVHVNGTVVDANNETGIWTEHIEGVNADSGHFESNVRGYLYPPQGRVLDLSKSLFDSEVFQNYFHVPFITLDESTAVANWTIHTGGDSSTDADGNTDWIAKNEGHLTVNGKTHDWTVDSKGHSTPPHEGLERFMKAVKQIPGL